MTYRVKITAEDGKEFWSSNFYDVHKAIKECERWRKKKGLKANVFCYETGKREY